MNNVNAPAHLSAYAAENNVDLAEYGQAVAELVALGTPGRRQLCQSKR